MLAEVFLQGGCHTLTCVGTFTGSGSLTLNFSSWHYITSKLIIASFSPLVLPYDCVVQFHECLLKRVQRSPCIYAVASIWPRDASSALMLFPPRIKEDQTCLRTQFWEFIVFTEKKGPLIETDEMGRLKRKTAKHGVSLPRQLSQGYSWNSLQRCVGSFWTLGKKNKIFILF